MKIFLKIKKWFKYKDKSNWFALKPAPLPVLRHKEGSLTHSSPFGLRCECAKPLKCGWDIHNPNCMNCHKPIMKTLDILHDHVKMICPHYRLQGIKREDLAEVAKAIDGG